VYDLGAETGSTEVNGVLRPLWTRITVAADSLRLAELELAACQVECFTRTGPLREVEGDARELSQVSGPQQA
jgi:hypothetical protein